MSVTGEPVSKVLVLDDSPEHMQIIKRFCGDNNLVPLRAKESAVMSVLKSNVDLGAILYSERYGGSQESAAQIAKEIHAARPELPIIVHRDKQTPLTVLHADLQAVCCAAYVADDLTALRKAIDEYIFCLIYPNALLRGIREIIGSSLTMQLRDLQYTFDTPYIVRDHIIFGEVFSLIPLESSWCRGYMTLQTEETAFLNLLGRRKAQNNLTFRDLNDLLGELTNLIWGAFKNRYIDAERVISGAQVQVPLIVNHKHKYISFGTQNPQLCFRFRLHDEAEKYSATVYARFIFNLNWLPEQFKESPADTAGLVNSGELELF
jgi:hypothetical protein